MRYILIASTVLAACLLQVVFAGDAKPLKPKPETTTTTTTTTTVVTTTVTPAVHQPTIRLALLLDTSNSMDGLIGQAKTQLWTIVNQFSKVTHNGQRPRLLVALYRYGTPSLGVETGYIKQLLPFTTELDQVSEKLYGLQTNGGDEFCGAVIKAATDQLQWEYQDGDFNAIFIAGNEPFTQGPVDFRKSCAAAAVRHIIINTIFCGQMSEGISTYWKEGADIGQGSYSSINQDAVAVYVPAPQDKELSELSTKLNTTYVYYGVEGRAKASGQVMQDANAAASGGGSAFSRAVVKGSPVYAGSNSSWDAIDAEKAGKLKLEEVDAKTLPENMQRMNMEERKQYIADKAAERSAIQAKIGKLSREREAYLEDKSKEKGDPATLDTAMVKLIRAQILDAGYAFDGETAKGGE